MGVGPTSPPTSPWTWQAEDYLNRVLSISVPFNTTTLALQGATVVRDPGCLYANIYIGTGTDGTPDTTTHKISVPFGTTNLTANQLSKVGLNTLTDITSLQITAGP